MPTLLCNCNQSMPLDGAAIGAALGAAPLTIHTALCRNQIGAYRAALPDAEPLTVACTQEKSLFVELANQSAVPAIAPIRFVNLRETGGWASDARAATPKIAALLAAAALPDPAPVATVGYRSGGNTLIIGPADAALAWAERFKGQLGVSVLITGGATTTALPAGREYPVMSGADVRIAGWLGAFTVQWRQRNPIDLDTCTRCGKCVEVCPEDAIDASFQIDASRCRDHRDCVKACGAIGAIDFTRAASGLDRRESACDLIFDLSPAPLIDLHQPPQGYFAPGADVARQFGDALALTQMIGEFEKPKFFAYKEKLCAHSRSGQPGCNACIDVCSTRAIAPDGDCIRVTPELCMGCGACATVCPSGALGYAWPRPADQGTRLRTLLSTYRKAGGTDALLLLHSPEGGAARIAELGRAATGARRLRGVPARVIPVEVFHVASVGLDLWLAALAWGANQVAVLVTGEEAPTYIAALETQLTLAQTIMTGLGYAGRHVHLLRAADARQLDQQLHDLAPAGAVARAASFAIAGDKRASIEFAVDHLLASSPALAGAGDGIESLDGMAIALPVGAPFGAIDINRDTCTLCMACVGACPESALMDNAELPQLRFVERNCVQCGLCMATCPEQALSMTPRLALGPAARAPVVLNETQPFHCVRCARPFGTQRMITTMLAKLAGHAAFSGAAAERLKMCGDCRVIDMMTHGSGTTRSDRP